jgi:uncharacterized membrane protein
MTRNPLEWIGVGAAIGIIYGLLLENIGLGVALGVCIGAAAGYYKTTKTHALVVGVMALFIAFIASTLGGGVNAAMGAIFFIMMGLTISYSAHRKGGERMNENTTRIAALALGVIALGVALFYMGPSVDDGIKATIIAVGFALLGIAIVYSFQRRGEVMKDERTTMITNKSLAWSWWLTYVFIAALLWLSHYGKIALSAQDALSYIFFFMVFSSMFTKMYLKMRGDA